MMIMLIAISLASRVDRADSIQWLIDIYLLVQVAALKGKAK
jgi:hypothetical protein